MKYLSLFSGIGGFELAIQDVYPESECIGFSEIDKHAIQTYRKHYPEHPHLGSITDINPLMLPDFDLMVGGFPCQDLSIAKAGRKGLDGERSGLFWTMLSILRLKNPKWFCFENVASMPKKDRDIITTELGVEPVMINASLVSAQSRKRLFWCNWSVEQPEDRGILLRDILESGNPIGGANNGSKSYCIDANYYKGGKKESINQSGKRLMISDKPVYVGSRFDGTQVCIDNTIIRKLTPVECERLQCFPDGWTDGVSNTQRYRQLGNAVNVEVVKHIFEQFRSGE